MERSQLFDLMSELQLYGMKAAFDEIMATAVKRQHEPQRIIGDLLTAEISEKKVRSIKYQLTIAKLPLAKDLDDFQFEGTPINETLVHDLASGAFLAQQRNAVLVGGTGTGKTHLAIAIARSCIRTAFRGRFYNVVDLVNRLETEARNARQGRLADHLTRMDFVILDGRGKSPIVPRRRPRQAARSGQAPCRQDFRPAARCAACPGCGAGTPRDRAPQVPIAAAPSPTGPCLLLLLPLPFPRVRALIAPRHRLSPRYARFERPALMSRL
jgi:hypothetical protein